MLQRLGENVTPTIWCYRCIATTTTVVRRQLSLPFGGRERGRELLGVEEAVAQFCVVFFIGVKSLRGV